MNAQLTATVPTSVPLFGGKEYTLATVAVPAPLEGIASKFLSGSPLIVSGTANCEISGGTVVITPSVAAEGVDFPDLTKDAPTFSENIGVIGAWLLAKEFGSQFKFEVDLKLEVVA